MVILTGSRTQRCMEIQGNGLLTNQWKASGYVSTRVNMCLNFTRPDWVESIGNTIISIGPKSLNSG